jgi:transposase InsO family protein
VNHKRVVRVYAEAGLQVKKRRRKKIPLRDRHPLERPTSANQVWSMDFVFDRTAEGRSIESLTVVDDATHEAVAIVPERALGGNHTTAANPGTTCRHQRAVQSYTDRQRQRVLQSCHAYLGLCTGRAIRYSVSMTGVQGEVHAH